VEVTDVTNTKVKEAEAEEAMKITLTQEVADKKLLKRLVSLSIFFHPGSLLTQFGLVDQG
jgi:hypothetical protein